MKDGITYEIWKEKLEEAQKKSTFILQDFYDNLNSKELALTGGTLVESMFGHPHKSLGLTTQLIIQAYFSTIVMEKREEELAKGIDVWD